MFNIFARKPVMVKVWCNSVDAEREFDSWVDSKMVMQQYYILAEGIK